MREEDSLHISPPLDRVFPVNSGSEANELADRHGVLLSTDGPFDNVIKIKPPMVFNVSDANRVIGTIDRALMTVTDT